MRTSNIEWGLRKHIHFRKASAKKGIQKYIKTFIELYYSHSIILAHIHGSASTAFTCECELCKKHLYAFKNTQEHSIECVFCMWEF